MKKTVFMILLVAALALSLAGCGKAPAAQSTTPAAETQTAADEKTPSSETTGEAAEPQSEPSETPEAPSRPARADGERFEDVIMIEGMEETVNYEHIRNAALGFEMDYDYERFARQSDADRERFVSVWDNTADPEDYLEVRSDPGKAELVADAIIATLSQEYDVTQEYRELDRAGKCIHIAADVIKGTNRMAEQLQYVCVIPAPDGCRVATAHCSIEDSEGILRRFSYMLNTLSVMDRGGEAALSDEVALSAVRQYCYDTNPELEGIVNAGEYPVSWEIAASDMQEIVVLFRSYTGAEIRYYIDRATGETYVTEYVPGVTSAEERTEERLNVWDYLG